MDISYKYVKSDREIEAALETLVNQPLIALDTETTGLDPHSCQLLLLQLSDGIHNYVLDLTATNSLSRKDLVSPSWRMLQDILQGPSTKIAHNMIFDMKILRAHCGYELSGIYDTMIAERILTAGMSASKKFPKLAEIVPKYTDLTTADMKKEIRAGFYQGYILDSFSDDQLEYAARDVAVLFPIYWDQMMQLQRQGMVPTAMLEFSTIPVTASMEFTGVNFDLHRWTTAIQEIEQIRISKRRAVEAIFKEYRLEKQNSLFQDFCTISIDSNAQLLEALKRLGINVDDSTGKEILDRLKGDHPVIESLLEYRVYKKLVESYGEGLLQKINHVTGRLHGKFNQIGADTGRYSSNDPNLQNIPGDDKCALRDCFIPPEGYTALGADYSQQELRVLAGLSNEENMLEAYKNGEDLHTQTTALLFKRDLGALKAMLDTRDEKLSNKQYESVTDEEKEAVKQRKISKSINFLIAYGGTYKRLAAQARVDEHFAMEIMDHHAAVFPALQRFIMAEGDRTLGNGFSQTVLGRKRFYTLPPHNDPEYRRIESAVRRQGVNHIIQGTSADITKYALVLIHDRFTRTFGRENAYIWAVIHDEIQTMVRTDLIREATQVMTGCMEEAFYRFIPAEVCPIKVDAKSGPHWVH